MATRIAGLLLAISIFSCSISCDSTTLKKLGQQNSIWSESIYFRGYRPSTGEILTEDHIRQYAQTLKSHNIKYAYIFAGPYGKDGHLPTYPFSDLAINTVKRLKQTNPELIILPWLGGVQNKTVYLGDSSWVKNALQDTERLIKVLGVPGVHIDFEYIIPGDPYLDSTLEKAKPGDFESYASNVNSFHRKLRTLCPNSFISSVVTSTSPDTRPWKRKTSINELEELLKYVDQLSFLYYDTQINDQDVFRENCKMLIKDIAFLKQTTGTRNVQFLIALGTFVNTPQLQKYRNLEIETISNTLTTIKTSQLEISDSMNIVDGIAIFCDWHTQKEEWDEFTENWANY